MPDTTIVAAHSSKSLKASTTLADLGGDQMQFDQLKRREFMTGLLKSFQYIVTDLDQFDVLQSGSAVGGVVPCPSWVISGHCRRTSECLLYPLKADITESHRHVR